jgi:hypothetical protein
MNRSQFFTVLPTMHDHFQRRNQWAWYLNNL